MELNQIFYIADYDKAYEACVLHAWTIKEIEADEKGRRFKIVERPKPSQNELLVEEMENLKKWLDNYYAQHEQKYRRLHTLGILTDEGLDPYTELIKLYNEAESKRKRIQAIEEVVYGVAR